jgi:periplasmic protein TonB
MDIDTVLRARARPRSFGFLMVLALHVALVWLVTNGLGLRLGLEPPPPRLQATFNERIPTDVDPPPLPPAPSVGPTRVIEVEPPEFTLPPDDPPTGDTLRANVAENPGGTALPEPRRLPASIDPRHPLTQPPYPSASIRFGEEGTVTVEVRVGTDGRVRESRLRHSSGFPRLDAAALEEARRVWRLKPATVDGEPVETWHAVRVSFRLDRR